MSNEMKWKSIIAEREITIKCRLKQPLMCLNVCFRCTHTRRPTDDCVEVSVSVGRRFLSFDSLMGNSVSIHSDDINTFDVAFDLSHKCLHFMFVCLLPRIVRSDAKMRLEKVIINVIIQRRAGAMI